MFRQPGPVGPRESACFDSQSKQGSAGTASRARYLALHGRVTGRPIGVVYVGGGKVGLMGFLDWLQRLFGSGYSNRFDLAELARRLGVEPQELRRFVPSYRVFRIPKRSGGEREIAAPAPELKALQRGLLRRVLRRLRTHPAVTGFERGHSIVTNARCHAGRAVVVRMDLRDFFPSTSAARVKHYWRGIGWNAEAAGVLTKLCTHRGRLPQGAPTSPRLANLVNFPMDARLAGLADRYGAVYTRYADDLTFSFERDDRRSIHSVVHLAKVIVGDSGYRLHQGRKLRIRRGHQRQLVTGLVVNAGVNLPRRVRRRLRAIEHRLAVGRAATLSEAQVAGWRALRQMVEQQRG